MIEVVRTLTEGDLHLVLRRKGDALELIVGSVVLLSSAALETERAFGHLARGRKRVLIGGLGFGSTLRGVLEVVPEDAEIIVVEKLAAVIDIARKESAEFFAGALDDPRVRIHNGDVATVIERSRGLDAILLDVDNGPAWASFRGNARLYTESALAVAKRALAPSGLYSVWSGYPRDAFTKVLRAAGLQAAIEPLRERGAIRARAYIGRLPP